MIDEKDVKYGDVFVPVDHKSEDPIMFIAWGEPTPYSLSSGTPWIGLYFFSPPAIETDRVGFTSGYWKRLDD